MSADDVYLAMVALEDPEKAEQAADGDWSVLGELNLTEDERELVSALIEEEGAESAGFAGGAMFAAASYTSGKVSSQLMTLHDPVQFRFGAVLSACGACECKTRCQGRVGKRIGT
jgi:hypothetical protein